MLKINFISRGDIKNPKLWSGTPSILYEKFSENKDIQITEISWNIWKPIISFYCVIISKLMFIWGTTTDPLLYKISKCLLNSKCKHHKDGIFFMTPEICIPKNVCNKHCVNYTDSMLCELLPYLEKKPFKKWFTRKYNINLQNDYDKLSLLFTQNEWSKQVAITQYKINPKKVYNVRFGVNLTPFQGIKDYNQNLLLIVLRKGTEEYKGLKLLLKAFPLIKETIKDVKLAVVGTDMGKNIDGVTCYYNQPRSTTIELFQKCTLYTMPALREPNGITYLEGLANKAPIVGLNRFAFPEFSGNGEWGFICNNDDPQELADTIIKALSDKETLKIMGEKGQKFVIENYNWDKVVNNMIDIMKKEL
ncbi:glycosyltransferase family 4 protein [Phocaeicola plebeius]|uniref:glycosyltransferase family 4 protein n=1 Tax=Phocaeicola plebeius TaxID=310297 RepID=UPI0026EAF127|nr:glycosyltransferase family 4 protein [Phocaeicola plebeius]